MFKKKGMIAAILFFIFVLAGSISATLIFADRAITGIPSGNWENYSESWVIDISDKDNLEIDLESIEVEIQPVQGSQITADFEGIRLIKGNEIPKISMSQVRNKVIFMESTRDTQYQNAIILGPISSSITGIQGKLLLNVPEDMLDSIKVSTFSGNIMANGISCYEMLLNTSSSRIEAADITAEYKTEFNTFSGDISLNHIKAEAANISASSGKIDVVQIDARAIEIEEFSGNTKVSGIIAEERLSLSSSSGNVDADEITTDELKISTFSGKVTLNSAAARESVYVDTSSGDITYHTVMTGKIDTITFSGRIKGSQITADTVNMESSSGDVEMELLKTSDVKAESFSGNVTLILPEDAAFDFNFITFSGKRNLDYLTDFDNTDEDSLSGHVGGDSEKKITIDTSSGNITVRP